MNILKFIRSFFSKSKEAEQVTDSKEHYPKIIILGPNDVLPDRRSKCLTGIDISDMHQESVNMEQIMVSPLVIYKDCRGWKVISDRCKIFSDMPMLCLREGRTLTPMSCDTAKDVLISNGYIDVFWSKEDIQERLNEREIEIEDFYLDEIASYIYEAHDSNVGLSWSSIDEAIDYVVDEIIE